MCVCLFLRVFFLLQNSPLFLVTKFSPLYKFVSHHHHHHHHGGTPGEHLRDGEGPRELPVLLQGKRGPKRQSRSRDLFFVICVLVVFSRVESNRIELKSIHIEHSLTFLSLSLTLTLSRTPRRCGLSRTITKCIVGCCFHTTFAWDQNDTDRRVQTRRAMLSIA